MGRESGRCRGRRPGSIYPVLALAGQGRGSCRVPLCLCEKWRPPVATLRNAAVAAGGSRGQAGGGAIVHGHAGARRAAGPDRCRAGQLAGRPARSTGHEDLGRPVLSADRPGPGNSCQHGRVALPLRSDQAARSLGGGIHSMMPTPDPLETDLSSLIPRQPSPGFRRRLGARLAHAPRAKSRRLWWLAVSTGLAAACLAALLWWWPGSGKTPEQVQRTPPRPQVGVEETAPTVLACQRALARSPEELDAFLSRQ